MLAIMKTESRYGNQLNETSKEHKNKHYVLDLWVSEISDQMRAAELSNFNILFIVWSHILDIYNSLIRHLYILE